MKNWNTKTQLIFFLVLTFAITTSCSVFMGWLREKYGTVWTAALTHGTHNIWIQGIYPFFVKAGPLDQYFGGESGVFLAGIYGLSAFLIYQKYLNKSVRV